MTAFTEVSIVTDGEAAEAVAEALRPFAYQESVVLEQKGDPHSLDPMAVEPEVKVKIFIAQDRDTPQLRRKIEEILYFMGRLYPLPEPQFTLLEEKDWASAWKENYHPFRVGRRIWIRPSWYGDDDSAGAANAPEDIILVMDPGMAFGTGLHPTTQACLSALENCIREGDEVLDVGTGTGILAITAAKLGARTITALDTDEQAISSAAENGRINEVSEKITLLHGDLSVVDGRPRDVVVVNILAPVIIDLLESGGLLDYVRPGGYLILSGIIDEQEPDVEKAIVRLGGEIQEKLRQRDWVSFVVQPAGKP